MNKSSNDYLSFSDSVIFQKSILGSVIKRYSTITKVKDFQNKFMNVLQNLKNLDNTLYQNYVNNQARFVIETFEREQKNGGKRREILKTYDITDQIKNKDFDLNNASYVLKLHFSLNDTSQLREYLQYTDVIRIKANDILLLYKDEVQEISCKNWMFNIDYDFTSLDKAKENFSKSYSECKASNFDQKNQNDLTSDSRIFEEFFVFNLLSFLINFKMTIFIVRIIIEIFKYRILKIEKVKKYRWLLRNKKNFDGKKALKQILPSNDHEIDIHIFSF